MLRRATDETDRLSFPTSHRPTMICFTYLSTKKMTYRSPFDLSTLLSHFPVCSDEEDDLTICSICCSPSTRKLFVTIDAAFQLPAEEADYFLCFVSDFTAPTSE